MGTIQMVLLAFLVGWLVVDQLYRLGILFAPAPPGEPDPPPRRTPDAPRHHGPRDRHDADQSAPPPRPRNGHSGHNRRDRPRH